MVDWRLLAQARAEADRRRRATATEAGRTGAVSATTVAAVLRAAAARLGQEEGPDDAAILLTEVLGVSRAWLVAHGSDPIDPLAAARFEHLVVRRVAGEPIAYLIGRRGFHSLELDVGPAVLIPRPETELLVELALERMRDDRAVEVADLGTGSGALALAIAVARPQARLLASDASAAALAVAKANAQRLGLANVAFVEGSWWVPLAGRRFDLIVSNPPYIALDDPHLDAGDLRFEPRSALVAGADGLDDLRLLAAGAPAYLKSGGALLVEHGHTQGEAVRALFAAAGLGSVATHRDLEGRDRVTEGTSRA
jgi:release factor glutamine methyltransferase